MQFIIALLVGLGLGFGLLALSRRQPSSAWPRWTLLGVGVVTLLVFLASILRLMDTDLAIIPSIALPFLGMVFGVGLVTGGDRRWQSWVGLVLAAIPGLFWIVFVVAEFVAPHG